MPICLPSLCVCAVVALAYQSPYFKFFFSASWKISGRNRWGPRKLCKSECVLLWNVKRKYRTDSGRSKSWQSRLKITLTEYDYLRRLTYCWSEPFYCAGCSKNLVAQIKRSPTAKGRPWRVNLLLVSFCKFGWFSEEQEVAVAHTKPYIFNALLYNREYVCMCTENVLACY